VRSTERPEAPLPKRSALAGLPGVPWWGAVALAVGCTALGAAGDILTSAPSVTGAFNWLYAIGCVLAALVVANTGLFTAAVQPSLILFIAVPLTTWLISPGQQASNKAIVLIALPLISRFPWMAWVSGVVLAICLVRWALWRLAERRERLVAARAKAKGAKQPAERRAAPSVPPVRRHKGSPDVPARKLGFVDGPESRDLPLSPRRRTELPPERRTAARKSGGQARPRIDPRGLESLRHTPVRGLPPLPNGARYRQEPPTRNGSLSSRSARHALPPARVPAPPEPRQASRRRRYDYED
jgi:hypothetical protein